MTSLAERDADFFSSDRYLHGDPLPHFPILPRIGKTQTKRQDTLARCPRHNINRDYGLAD